MSNLNNQPDDNGILPMVCRHCEKEWTVTLPTLPILAGSFLRILRAYLRCPYCFSRKTAIRCVPKAE